MLTFLTIKFYLPGCSSLKEKKSRLAPILTRTRKEFNISISEIGLQDVWQSAWIGIACISNDKVHNEQVLDKVIKFLEDNFPDEQIIESHLEAR